MMARSNANEAARLHPDWWMAMIWGILAVIMGVFLIAAPGLTAVILAQVIAAYWLVGGVFEVVGSLVYRTARWGWRLFSGVVSILAGVALLSSPLWGAWFLVSVGFYLMALAAIVHGLVNLFGVGGRTIAKTALGVLQVLIGIYLLMNPLAGILAFIPVLGIVAIAGGLMAIFFSLALIFGDCAITRSCSEPSAA